ncbi:MAG: LytTR family DNA-binding domain-containing protein [Bacteroidota bacterium]
MRAVIIEDEPFARHELKRLITNVDSTIQFVKEIDSVQDAVEWLSSSQQFDIIFLDIQLADGLSFEIFDHVKITKPIIFTTAYDEYAIKAFQLNSIDYLLKPIEEKALQKALDKLNIVKESFASQTIDTNKLRDLFQPVKTYKSRFLTKIGDQYKFIPVDDVAYFYAERNTIYLVNSQGQKSIVDFRLDELEHQLDPKLFFRATRSYIVSIKSIRKVNKYFNSRLLIEVEPKAAEEILVSRVKVDDFLTWMDS